MLAERGAECKPFLGQSPFLDSECQ